MQPQKAEALSTVLERSNASVLQQVSWTMVCRALIEGSLGCRFSSWAKDQPLPGSGSFSVVLQYGASLFSGELGRFMNHALFPYARPDEIGMNFVTPLSVILVRVRWILLVAFCSLWRALCGSAALLLLCPLLRRCCLGCGVGCHFFCLLFSFDRDGHSDAG